MHVDGGFTANTSGIWEKKNNTVFLSFCYAEAAFNEKKQICTNDEKKKKKKTVLNSRRSNNVMIRDNSGTTVTHCINTRSLSIKNSNKNNRAITKLRPGAHRRGIVIVSASAKIYWGTFDGSPKTVYERRDTAEIPLVSFFFFYGRFSIQRTNNLVRANDAVFKNTPVTDFFSPSGARGRCGHTFSIFRGFSFLPRNLQSETRKRAVGSVAFGEIRKRRERLTREIVQTVFSLRWAPRPNRSVADIVSGGEKKNAR